MLECATVAYRNGQLTIDEMHGIVEEADELELAYDRESKEHQYNIGTMINDIRHMDNAIEEIAKQILDISSLKTTNSGEDFHERAVWVLKAALEDAWCCGYNTAHPLV